MKKVLFFASVAVLALGSCKKDDKEKETTFKGEVKTFQHGKAWTWYEEDVNGKPLRIAIAIDDAAMNSLDRETGGGHNHANSISMQLHAEAGATPFKHVMLDWNPAGHPPNNIYTKPHFDFHFYTTTEAERLAIPLYEEAQEKFDNFPLAYMPANYIPIPGGVPQMGTHWVDQASPELRPGGNFTQTFMYGSYDGEVTFYEPMITEEFLLANPSFQRDIPVPAKFQEAGWYPTKMRIEKENGVTNVIIENFVQRQAN
ncbi:MAG TPA: hypothetical protein VGN63_10175 [Flavisolibacter sp.]|nr:hypothetical protein [Flavisolibacter sp.]